MVCWRNLTKSRIGLVDTIQSVFIKYSSLSRCSDIFEVGFKSTEFCTLIFFDARYKETL